LIGGQLLGRDSIGNYLYGKLFLLQLLAEKIRQRRVIFGDKNAHVPTQTTWILEGVNPVWIHRSGVSRR
jgi:hypothetical protein